MPKTHSRQKSTIPMIDEELSSRDIVIVGQPHDKYVNDQAFITVESSPSEKTPSTLISPQTTSLQSSNNNLIKDKKSRKRKGSICCKVCCALFSLILFIVLIAAGIYYWQVHSHSESRHHEAGVKDRIEDRAYTLPRGGENVTTRTPSSTLPTLVTSRTTPTISAFSMKTPKIFKSLEDNMDKKRNFVISPLGFDYSMSVLGYISNHAATVSSVYFGESESALPQIYPYLKNFINDSTSSEYGHNTLRLYGNGEVSDRFINSTNIPVGKFDDIPLIYIGARDYNSLSENADFISREFDEKTRLGYLNNLGKYLMNPGNSIFGINTFNFAMEFEQSLSLVDPNVPFHTKYGEIEVQKHVSFTKGTLRYMNNENTVVFTLPLKDTRFRFFVYMGNKDNSKTRLPALNIVDLARNLRQSGPIKDLKVAIPHFEITNINEFNQAIVNKNLKDICVRFPDLTDHKCVKLTNIIQGVHFRISGLGINIPIQSNNDVKTGSFKDYKKVVNVDRPFYFGVWFQDSSSKTAGFVYFGAYLGPNSAKRLI
ncbi:hypothetical protein FO519_002416 [Halicephalobus sp. NKZ332]|nr:hypothetical protein FO519_002416 [Halicephalobus sp. NKZ332]